MKKLLLIPILAVLMGCASTGNIQQTLGSPQQVQADVTVLGAVAKPHVPANAQSDIHTFATQLNALANLDSSQLVALIPHTGSTTADALIASSAGFINIALANYGKNNSTTLAYAHAVANGLLANF